MVELNKKQAEGLETVVKKYQMEDDSAIVSGFAGTGKSFLVSKIIDKLGLAEGEYATATFTGKAAQVQQQKGQHNARTLHKLLYNSFKTKDGFVHTPKKVGDEALAKLKLIVVDEFSMVPENIIRALEQHKIFIIYLGDPAQLPPIGQANSVMQREPDVFLDEVMRQADGNSIVEWSMKVREGKRFKWENDDFVQIIDQKDVVSGMYTWADQILCFKNATRNRINQEMRQILGHSGPIPQEGEKMIVTKNNWERLSLGGHSWVNGMIGYVSNITELGNHGPVGNPLKVDLRPDFDGAPFFNVPIDGNPFYGFAPLDTGRMRGEGRPEVIDFGYCITTHKSQGSEYDKVMLFEEDWRIDQLVQILYTAGTRARLRLLIVRKPHGSFFL